MSNRTRTVDGDATRDTLILSQSEANTVARTLPNKSWLCYMLHFSYRLYLMSVWIYNKAITTENKSKGIQ